MKHFYLLMLHLLFLVNLHSKPFVTAVMQGQLGNKMFIVAAASAYAWDHGVDSYFPELQYVRGANIKNMLENLDHIFFRCNVSQEPEPIKSWWREKSHLYTKIPFQENLKIFGYFQSEKYFAHHRDKILELFAPHSNDLQYIQSKYKDLLERPCTVGVQIRKYFEDPNGHRFIQYGKDYVRRAMEQFPPNAFFLIFSNDKKFAKDNVPEEMKNRTLFVENEPHYIDLHLMSLCKHNIITNSSFGWWGAWLNKNPNKKVIAPLPWINPQDPLDMKDQIPDSWTVISAKWGSVNDPSTYQ